MKVLEMIKSIFTWIIGCIFFGFVIIITVLVLNFNDFGVTQFGGKSLLIIDDNISSEKYNKGDLVIVESKRIDKIEQGDELFTYKLDSKNVAHINFGTVGEVYPDEDAITYQMVTHIQ